MGLLATIGAALRVGTGVARGVSVNRQNIAAQERINSSNQSFTREMYDRTRSDALEDARSQNEYNTPANQMARYRAAGLNPNLIYGSATNTPSAVIRPGQTPSGNSIAPKISHIPFGDAIAGGMDMMLKSAQLDQTRQVTKNLMVDNILKQLGVLGKQKDNIIKGVQADNAEDLWAELIEKLRTSNEILHNQDRFQSETYDARVNLLGQQLANMQKDGKLKDQMLQNLKREEELKKLNAILEANGLTGFDPLYIKSIIKFLTTGSFQEAVDEIAPYLKQ